MNTLKQQIAHEEKVDFPPQDSPMIAPQSLEKQGLRIRVISQMLYLALKNLKSLPKTFRLVRRLLAKFEQTNDIPPFIKVAKVDGRYFWGLGVAGYPSKSFQVVIENEMNRIIPFKPHDGLRTLLIAITKKCPLNCEHCFEWPNLNQKETLSTSDLIHLVKTYQTHGTPQIIFGGGEPMVRIKDLCKVLETTGPGTDFWLYTSGFGFSYEHAQKLKATGLTGVLVSIDHHDPESHDRFRGYSGAFEAAVQACILAKKAGLVVGISLCARPDYATSENLHAYMKLGRKLGTSFVQFVEARSTGRYQQKNVTLSEKDLHLLKEIYLQYNISPEYGDYPIIDWPDDKRRNIGCFAGGNRSFYIDTDGDAHVCPFCSSKICSALTNDAPTVIGQLKQNACHIFEYTQV